MLLEIIKNMFIHGQIRYFFLGGRNIHKDLHHCRNCIGDTWLLFRIRERKRNSTLLIQYFPKGSDILHWL